MKILNKRIFNLKKNTAFLLAVFLILFFIIQSVSAAATPPRIVSYQGRVLNANSVPVSDTTVDISFEFYSALSGGTCLWSNSSATCVTATARTITLTDGLFSENLGDTGDSYAAISETIFSDNAAVYLQVTIEGEALTPRKQMVAVPYALNADMLDGVSSTSFFQLTSDNSVSGANDFSNSTLTGQNALVFEGSTDDDYETTFAFVDPASSDKTITFQNASGTVALLNDIGWTDGGTVVYTTTSTDDIAVGASTASTADFGVSPSTGLIYFGDGTNDPTLRFKDSLGGTADITYSSDDWTFDGGDLIHTPTGTYPSSPGSHVLFDSSSTVSASPSGGAGLYELGYMQAVLTNTAVEGAGEQYEPFGIKARAINGSTGTVQNITGIAGTAENSSTAASAVGASMYGVSGQVSNTGAGSTVPTAIGIYGVASGSGGNITDAYGVQGSVASTGVTITNGFGGDFSSASGTSRYGVRASAASGVNNYAGYFYNSAVHIELTSTPTIPDEANGAGDLYIGSQLEIDGDGVATDAVLDIQTNQITSGIGFNLERTNNVSTEFSNTTTGLASIQVTDTGSTGTALYASNSGVGYSMKLNQVGDQTALAVQATNTTDYIAKFFNDGGTDDNMGIEIQGCLDTNPTTACNYLVFKDGDGTVLGAVEGNGSGGVTNASAGSDYAELFMGNYSSFSEGDIIGLDTTGNVVLASDSDRIIGAFSIAPNTLGNWFDGWLASGGYVPVALLGQVPVNVNMEGGAITAGDYVALSTATGIAKKATGVGYVLGQALESHSSGSGTIQVYIKPTWQAIGVLTDEGSMTLVSDDFALGSTGTANASIEGMDSYGLMLRGSGWDGSNSQDISMGFTTHVTNASEYKLSIEDQNNDQLAFINQDGDFALSGKLYPSDRGSIQTDKYIYYDGSTGLGGDFMRTNASGWGSGSYDFAEMFPSVDSVSPGEIVVFANDKESVMRSTGVIYDDRIAGIISTQPGFLAGQNIDSHVPVALAGRVPTYVSSENGSIQVGDPLTTSSTPGYAMKAVEPGPIVGYAMEDFDNGTGSIIVFVRPSYYDGAELDLSDNQISELIPSSSLDLSGTINLNGGSLISVSSLVGIGNHWSVDDNGTFRTGGRYVQEIESYGGEKIETYAVTSRETVIQISGTIKLEKGRAHVYFDDYDESFSDIVSLTAPYRVFLTADGQTGSLYAINREVDGFIIRDADLTPSANIDWLVIAYHKDFEPAEIVEEDNIAEQEDELLDEENSDQDIDGESEEVIVDDSSEDQDLESDNDQTQDDQIEDEEEDQNVEDQGVEVADEDEDTLEIIDTPIIVDDLEEVEDFIEVIEEDQIVQPDSATEEDIVEIQEIVEEVIEELQLVDEGEADLSE